MVILRDLGKRIPFFKRKEWFLILAHTGHDETQEKEQTIKMQIDAVEGENLDGMFDRAEQISREKSIPILKSSNAYKLEDIGKYYTELELI